MVVTNLCPDFAEDKKIRVTWFNRVGDEYHLQSQLLHWGALSLVRKRNESMEE